MRSAESERLIMQASAGDRLGLIAESFARLAGMPLVGFSSGGIERALWEAPRGIVAQGTDPEPRFFYGNRLVLELLAMSATDFIGTVASTLAEPVLREESTRLTTGLTKHGIVDIYAVVGIATNGRRFAIADAQLWNLVDRQGRNHGLGTTFAEWQFLDQP